MELYIGGAFQGQKEYVDNEYRDIKKLNWYNGQDPVDTDISDYDAICNYHEIIRRQVGIGIDPEAELEKILDHNPQIIIVCDEVGCGVIPIDSQDRAYREAVGRCMCKAASRADRVVRIICGIGQVIKDVNR
ncbi:bifunctional adenosylcobinamide kinase/adenosylcobinamide-phosphate guanylyltransferase [Butyrivibrio fibrisolvens]|uniref:Adenosylcobinamide kinase n=1 Tax=Butyrivibrio fibrisolvens TaxID=831 RepID=A0A317G4R7_BUTFI|nr:bifunctional adenosylcobinamide kinase/adenosylcobinamide-phosphate guanylyltransferase [Butyrivibrio fibrisolvens]PWT29015.1 adenosylcobinamide kinase [Butyrivibrio fibrisolvens]